MFFKCAHHAPADDQPSGRVVSNGSTSRIVDIHCHRECAAAAEMMKAEAERVGFAALSFGSELTKEVNRQQLIDIKPKMESLDERIGRYRWQFLYLKVICMQYEFCILLVN